MKESTSTAKCRSVVPTTERQNVPTTVKVTIYKTILRPILTYESESWTLTTATKSKIQAAETRVLTLKTD